MTLSFAAPDRPQWSDQERIDEIHAAPKIGQHFGEQVSDHMAVADWTASEGWTGDAITDYQPLAVNPANAVPIAMPTARCGCFVPRRTHDG